MENKKNETPGSIIPPCPVNRWTINVDRCVLCRECIEACSRELLEVRSEMICINYEELCNECGDCAAVCGYNAIAFP